MSRRLNLRHPWHTSAATGPRKEDNADQYPMHHRIGVEVVRFGIIIRIKFQFKVTNDKFRLHFHHKILTRAAIIVRSL